METVRKSFAHPPLPLVSCLRFHSGIHFQDNQRRPDILGETMAIPWMQLVKFAPAILSTTQDLLQRARKVEKQATGNVDAGVQALAVDLQRQAEALHALAGQMEGLTTALVGLRRAFMAAIALGGTALLLGGAALILSLQG
jgi:hypothetical protein